MRHKYKIIRQGATMSDNKEIIVLRCKCGLTRRMKFKPVKCSEPSDQRELGDFFE